jgi:Protein of unknown function (DUF4231)
MVMRAQPDPPLVRRVLRGRPHQRTIEQVSFDAWIENFDHENQIDAATRIWFRHRFKDELDRRRALEKKWRIIFWSTRYVVLGGSLALPPIITASTRITWLNPVGIVISVFVALSTGAEVLLRTGPKWRLYRAAADNMSTEGTAFFQGIGQYASLEHTKRLTYFRERIEGMTTEFQQAYLEDVEAMVAQTPHDRPST